MESLFQEKNLFLKPDSQMQFFKTKFICKLQDSKSLFLFMWEVVNTDCYLLIQYLLKQMSLWVGMIPSKSLNLSVFLAARKDQWKFCTWWFRASLNGLAHLSIVAVFLFFPYSIFLLEYWCDAHSMWARIYSTAQGILWYSVFSDNLSV